MRTRDRLAELRHLSAAASGPPQPHAPPPAAPHAHVRDICQEVERARGWIHEVELQTQLVRRLHAHPTFHNNAQLHEQLEGAATAAQGAALKVSGALRQLAARAAEAQGRGDVAARVARLQAAATRALYARALRDHHAALDELRHARLRLLAEQVKLTDASLSAEECEGLLEECEGLLEEGRVALFVGNVRADTEQARRVLRDVEARRHELQRTERAVRDVRDLFEQLAQLVAAQQDHVDTVQYYALQASDHVGAGQHHLLSGTVTRTKARKKKLALMVCVAVGVAVVLLVLVIT